MPDRMPALPPARDFLLSAGFGGAAALVAALVIALIAWLVARAAAKRHQVDVEQRERHHREVREDEQRTAAIARCWQRLVWVVDTAGLEPAAESATLGLGPELAVEILRGLLRDAEQLSDDTLAGAVTVHLNQFSLVLARQAGPLSELTAAPDSSLRKASRAGSAAGSGEDSAALVEKASAGPSSGAASTASACSPSKEAGGAADGDAGADDAAPVPAEQSTTRGRRRAR